MSGLKNVRKGSKKKRAGVNFLQNQFDTVKAEGAVKTNFEVNTGIKDVDDKLIGDDLEMAIVKDEFVNNAQTADNNENNY